MSVKRWAGIGAGIVLAGWLIVLGAGAIAGGSHNGTAPSGASTPGQGTNKQGPDKGGAAAPEAPGAPNVNQ